MVIRKTPREIEIMRGGGQDLGFVLQELSTRIKPGMSTLDLDTIARKLILERGAIPAFMNYSPTKGKDFTKPFVHTLCVSINDELIHGVPTSSRRFKKGDVVKLDCGLQKGGFYVDAAITVGVGEISEHAKHLMKVTRESLAIGIQEAKPGNRVSDISKAVQNHIESAQYNGAKFSVVRDFCGHGLGNSLHEDPLVPNFYEPTHVNTRLQEGMVIAIEPMVIASNVNTTRIKEDGWTVTSSDQSLTAHYEHTVAITALGPWVLTSPERFGC